MDKVTGNYLSQSGKHFPMDCETLDYIAKNQSLCEMLGNIAGDKIIISGCEYSATYGTRSQGYVFLRTTEYPEGEVLRFEGGDNAETTAYVKSEHIQVNANGYTYPRAYTKRTLAAGLGAEQYNWEDFTPLHNCKDMYNALSALQTAFNNLTGEPLGIVKMWAGSTLPTGYLYCQGQSLSRIEYADLFDAIGTRFGSDDASTFKLPNLQGRFIVGYDGNDPDYDQLGETGGEKTHTLTVNEIPEHSHSKQVTINDGDGWEFHNDRIGATGGTNNPGGTWTSGDAGGGQSHENRPPFFVLAYIIKVE